MSTVDEIESAIKHLTAEQYKMFRKWFEEYESNLWDSQIEQDIRDGKLDKIAQEAIEEYESGNCSKL